MVIIDCYLIKIRNYSLQCNFSKYITGIPIIRLVYPIKSIEINQLPQLNDEIETMVSVLHEFMGVTLVDISSKLNGVEIAKGQMKTVLAN